MNPENDKKDIQEEHGEHTMRDKLSGFGQKVIGEIETFGGILTGDPTTRAEGEYNAEVGELREEIADDLEESEPPQTGTEAEKHRE